jgi:DNA-binding CsgD family transcriptional regulator
VDVTGIMQFQPAGFALLLGHWLSLWLGFYLIGRRPRSQATLLAGLAYLALATYLSSAAILLALEHFPHVMIWGGVLCFNPFAPPLLLHAFLRLTGSALPRERAVLVGLYTLAALVYVLSLDSALIYPWTPPQPGAAEAVNGVVGIGPLYPLLIVQTAGTLALAVLVLERARRAVRREGRPVPRQLVWLLAGAVLILTGSTLLFANVYLGSFEAEGLLQLVVLAGGILVAVAMARYPGLVEGQLLRTDLKASLLGSLLAMAAFVALVLVAGAGPRVLLGAGWFVLAVFLLRDDLRALADRVFYGSGERAARAGLRTAAVSAGSSEPLDLGSLSEHQTDELLTYLGSLDRAELEAARLEGPVDPRLDLLVRDEFEPVRRALELPYGWDARDSLDHRAIAAAVAERLEPRERQALGLKYLGYSDKEMARLMGVKPGVPRSYLSAGKRKLGLPAGAATMLFVHFAGLVEDDALPLLEGGGRAAPAELDADAVRDAEAPA